MESMTGETYIPVQVQSSEPKREVVISPLVDKDVQKIEPEIPEKKDDKPQPEQAKLVEENQPKEKHDPEEKQPEQKLEDSPDHELTPEERQQIFDQYALDEFEVVAQSFNPRDKKAMPRLEIAYKRLKDRLPTKRIKSQEVIQSRKLMLAQAMKLYFKCALKDMWNKLKSFILGIPEFDDDIQTSTGKEKRYTRFHPAAQPQTPLAQTTQRKETDRPTSQFYTSKYPQPSSRSLSSKV